MNPTPMQSIAERFTWYVLLPVIAFWIPATCILLALSPLITLVASIGKGKSFFQQLERVLRWETIAFPLAVILWIEIQHLGLDLPLIFYIAVCGFGSVLYYGFACVLGTLIRRVFGK